MGRNRQHRVRSVRQFLGRQSRNRGGSLRKYHPSGKPKCRFSRTTFPTFFQQIALFVIGVAGSLSILCSIYAFCCSRDLGFGRRITWSSDLIVPPGHQMTFKDALHTLASNLLLKMGGAPSWAMNLTGRTRRVNLAFDELKVPCRY